MNAPTTDITVEIILNNGNDFATKVADAELHFTNGPLAGLKLIGFVVWQSRRIDGVRVVTIPARQTYRDGQLHTRALLRPIDDYEASAYEPIRALILAACRAAEDAASTRTAEQLVREMLQPTHRLTDEQAIELTEAITAVMDAEQLNPRGAWA